MPAIWNPTLYFPSVVAEITIPSAEQIPLNPVTASSRAIIKKTSHAGTLPKGISIIRAAETRSLSARGSKNFPRVETRFRLRAKKPSSRSVIAAREKRIAAEKLHVLLGNDMRTTSAGTVAIL